MDSMGIMSARAYWDALPLLVQGGLSLAHLPVWFVEVGAFVHGSVAASQVGSPTITGFP
jgi:hypothetical protein